MKVTNVEKKENSTVELTIHVEADEFEAAVQKAYLKSRSRIAVPGFRKGKAPRKIIEGMYGSGVFYEDAINDVYPGAYEAAVKEQGLEDMGHPVMDIVEVNKEKGLIFTALVSVRPEAKVKAYKGLTAPKAEVSVTDEDVENELQPYVRRATRLISVDREVKLGDTAVIDFEGFEDGKPFEGGKGENYSLEIGSGSFVPGFEDQIIGLKAGDEKDLDITFPEDYVADLAGKAVVFKVKLHDVCVRQLPSMNSDFAKKVGGVDTMEEFREKVRKQLYDGRHGGALNHAKDQVLAKLADAAEGELPSVLVESTYQQEMQNVQQQLQMQRMTLNSYLSQIHETRESFTAKLHAGAEKNTRARMALLQIAQQENLVPTDEEIDKMIAERAERTKKTVEEIREKTNIPALKRTEAIRRAADWVIERSTIEEK